MNRRDEIDNIRAMRTEIREANEAAEISLACCQRQLDQVNCEKAKLEKRIQNITAGIEARKKEDETIAMRLDELLNKGVNVST